MILEPENLIERDSQLIVDMANMALRNYDTYKKAGFEDMMPGEEVVEEFRTVGIRLPRGAGHSTAALQLLYEHSDALLFIHNSAVRHHYDRTLRELIDDPNVRQRIMERVYLISEHRKLLSVRPVHERSFLIFDQASMMNTNMKEQIKEMFGGTKIIVELQ